jgi:hypothetical protein
VKDRTFFFGYYEASASVGTPYRVRADPTNLQARAASPPPAFQFPGR